MSINPLQIVSLVSIENVPTGYQLDDIKRGAGGDQPTY
jgi:hypothetical protein